MFPKLKSRDIIAILVIISIVVLRILGLDSNFDVVLAILLGYYFGRVSVDDFAKK